VTSVLYTCHYIHYYFELSLYLERNNFNTHKWMYTSHSFLVENSILCVSLSLWKWSIINLWLCVTIQPLLVTTVPTNRVDGNGLLHSDSSCTVKALLQVRILNTPPSGSLLAKVVLKRILRYPITQEKK
jgi:hypothetical protein